MSPTRLFRRRYTHAGAAPGTLRAHDEAVAPRVRVLRFGGGGGVEELESRDAAELRAMVEEERVTWIDVQGLADHDLIQRLGEGFGLHRLCVADIVNVGQRPKCEDYGAYLYVVVRMVVLDEEHGLRWEQVSVVLGKGYVLTFQEQYGDCLDGLRHRIRVGGPVVTASGADYLASQVIDSIVDGYFPVLENYGERLEDLESDILERPRREALALVYRIRRELVAFRRAAWPLRDTLNHLLRDRYALVVEPTLPYLRDTADHVMQVVDVLENYRELASSLVEVYLSAISFRTNEVMRVLTVISTIFIPLTFVAGIYGMNFDTGSPWNMPELGWRYGYAVFWLFSAALCGLLLLVFRRLGWLSGSADPEE